MANRTPRFDTTLRARYQRIGAGGVNTADRQRECDDLCNDVRPLVAEFLAALKAHEDYDNQHEDFVGAVNQRKPLDRRGTNDVVKLLSAGVVSVPAIPNYRFRYITREISPLRTTRANAADSGTGGIDYIAIVDSEPPTPILGEIKVNTDKDAYYAFIQLLTYLSEMASDAQRVRANAFLFKCSRIPPRAAYDLHILLVDYNDRGTKRALIEATYTLAARFKAALKQRGHEPGYVGRVMCLRASRVTFDGSLELVWCV